MKYIAFFRALNVGKNNRIKSGDLKALFEQSGAFNIHLIQQSGNVVFETRDLDAFTSALKAQLLETLNNPVYMVIFTAAEFTDLWQSIHPLKTEQHNGSWMQILLSKHPSKIAFIASEVDVELAHTPTWVVYHPLGVSKSNLKIKPIFDAVPESTFRNYNTLSKVYQKLLSV